MAVTKAGVFIDTWGWVSLLNERESRHEEVAALYRSLIGSKVPLYSSDYVLDETLTLLFRRLPPGAACAALEAIFQAVGTGALRIEPVDRPRFEKTVRLRRKLRDQPHISFTDLSSMVVMEELEVCAILTADAHFRQVGQNFQLVPD